MGYEEGGRTLPLNLERNMSVDKTIIPATCLDVTLMPDPVQNHPVVCRDKVVCDSVGYQLILDKHTKFPNLIWQVTCNLASHNTSRVALKQLQLYTCMYLCIYMYSVC